MIDAICLTILGCVAITWPWANAIERQEQLRRAALEPVTPSLPRAVAIPTAYRKEHWR
jgi:hypothetical protein